MSPAFPHKPWFRGEVTLGHEYEEKVAVRLREAGLVAEVTPLVIRPDEQDADDFMGQVDLWVSRPGGTPAKVECKSNRRSFTGPEDWPFSCFACYKTTKPSRDMPVLCISMVTEVIVGVLDYGEGRYVQKMTDRRPQHETTYAVLTAPNSSILTFDQWVDRAGEWLME